MNIKRILCVFLSLLMLAGCFTAVSFAETEGTAAEAGIYTVYASKDGDDSAAGTGETAPVKTLNGAIGKINAAVAADESITAGKIVLVGDVEISGTVFLTEHTVPLTVTSHATAKRAISFVSGDDSSGRSSLNLGGTTTFENVKVSVASGLKAVFYENSKGLIIGKNVDAGSMSGSTYSSTAFISGGREIDKDCIGTEIVSLDQKNTYIEIHSGTWARVTLFPFGVTDQMDQSFSADHITLIADNCIFTETGIDLHTQEWGTKNYTFNVNGDVNILLGKYARFTNPSAATSYRRVNIGLASDRHSFTLNGNVYVSIDKTAGSGQSGVMSVNYNASRITLAAGCTVKVSTTKHTESWRGQVSTTTLTGKSFATVGADLPCTPTLTGYQDSYASASEGGTYSARFLATLPTVEGLQKVGFTVTPKSGETTGEAVDIEGNTVYDSVTALDATVTAISMGGKYVYALVINGIPMDAHGTVEYTVTPYVIDANGNRVDGITKTVKPVA